MRREAGTPVLVVDDGSSDDTAGLAERALVGHRARVIRNNENRGVMIEDKRYDLDEIGAEDQYFEQGRIYEKRI